MLSTAVHTSSDAVSHANDETTELKTILITMAMMRARMTVQITRRKKTVDAIRRTTMMTILQQEGDFDKHIIIKEYICASHVGVAAQL